MAGIPTCIITGRIVGDGLACGDCDPCIMGASAVPEVVKMLLVERDEWMDKYADLASSVDELKCGCIIIDKPECPLCGKSEEHSHDL